MSDDPPPDTRPTPPADSLSLKLLYTGPVTVLAVEGDLDIGTSGALLDAVRRLRRDQLGSVLVLDLAGLRFCGADGLRTFLYIREMVPHLTLRNPSPFVRKIMTVTGLLERFDVQPR